MSGKGLELQRVEGVLPAAHVLRSILPAAALAGEIRGGGVCQTTAAAHGCFQQEAAAGAAAKK